MPQKIRVRGKKGNKQRVTESMQANGILSSPGPSSRPSTKQLSLLEKLPTEILEQIFRESNNLDFPGTSPTLCQKLSSEYVGTKIAFLIKSFGHHCDFEENDVQYWSDNERRGETQAQLLSIRWASPSIVLKAARQYYVTQTQKAIQFFQAKSGITDNVFPDVSKFFDRDANDGDQDHEPTVYEYQRNPGEDAPSFTVKIFRASEYAKLPLGVHIIIRFDPRVLTANDFTSACCTYRFPWLSKHFVIPKTLLRGPFTREKIELITIIYKSIAIDVEDNEKEIGAPSFDMQDALDGLEDAIREYNVSAIALFVKPKVGDRFYRLNQFEPPEGMEVSVPPGAAEDLGINPRLREEDSAAFFSLHVQTRHLIAALEAADARHDSQATIFRWLLPLAVTHHDTSLWQQDTAESFFKWAVNKKVEDKHAGIDNGLGTMALELWGKQVVFVKHVFEYGNT